MKVDNLIINLYSISKLNGVKNINKPNSPINMPIILVIEGNVETKRNKPIIIDIRPIE